MNLTSIGTPVVLRSICRDLGAGRAGFTLIEALVAMALLLAFVSVLGPYMFHARRIGENVHGRVAAQALLRAILDAPFDRFAVGKGAREGENGGMRWSIAAEPMFIDAMLPADGPVLSTSEPPKDANPKDANAKDANPKDASAKRPNWIAFRLVARVSWEPGQMITAETMRLGVDE